MTLILLSVVGNLFVLNSLREKEALLAITQNLVRPSFCSFMLTMKRGWGSRLTSIFQVLLNICFANLVSAIFIKSISIVHNGFDQPPICLTKIKRKFMSISFKEFISSLKEYTIVPFMYINSQVLVSWPVHFWRYAVAVRSTESQIAFCMIYTFGHRLLSLLFHISTGGWNKIKC